MKRIYLCGPISGCPDYEERFLKTEETLLNKIKLEGLQIKTVNPSQFPSKKEPWEIRVRYSIKAMLSCDGIALLQGWEESRGCVMKLSLAGRLKIPVVYLEPPVSADYIAKFFNYRFSDPFYSDIPRYFEKCLATETEQKLNWEEIALVETCNRFLDPYGFEYIEGGST
jgi:hypothetical protein